MDENLTEDLGKLIFNGSVLFMSISFGLFSFTIGELNVSVSSIIQFSFTIGFILLSGIGSLISSFIGIRIKKMWLIYISGGLFLVMILLLSLAYWQLFSNSLTESFKLVPK